MASMKAARLGLGTNVKQVTKASVLLAVEKLRVVEELYTEGGGEVVQREEGRRCSRSAVMALFVDTRKARTIDVAVDVYSPRTIVCFTWQ